MVNFRWRGKWRWNVTCHDCEHFNLMIEIIRYFCVFIWMLVYEFGLYYCLCHFILFFFLTYNALFIWIIEYGYLFFFWLKITVGLRVYVQTTRCTVCEWVNVNIINSTTNEMDTRKRCHKVLYVLHNFRDTVMQLCFSRKSMN